MDKEYSKMMAEKLDALIKELNGINEKLNYMCTQGIFVKVDEDISEN